MRFGRVFLLLFVLVVFTTSVFAANHYVIPSPGVGLKNGSDWGNAFGGFGTSAGQANPASLVRGDTYYVAGSATTYPAVSFSTLTSGAQLISIVKATQANSGNVTGWNASFGTTQAVFSTHITFTTDYWVFDGQTRNESNWFDDVSYGFMIQSTDNDRQIFIGGSYVRVAYTYILAPILSTSLPTVGMYAIDTTYNSIVKPGIVISHMYVKNGNNHFFLRNSIGAIVEYSASELALSTPNNHGENVNLYGAFGPCDNAVIRYNYFRNNFLGSGGGGTAVIAVVTASGVQIYGNIFQNNAHGDGVVGWTGTRAGYEVHNLAFYNNVIIGGAGGNQGVAIENNSTGSTAYNNLWVGNSPGFFAGITHNHNGFSGASNLGETDAQINIPTSIFNNYAGSDFTLKTNTNPGMNLSTLAGYTSQMGVDMFGHIRTTWSRGAYEYSGTSGTTVNVTSATWANQTFVRGNTYILAPGTYTGKVLNTPANGQVITIKSDGTGQAVFNGQINFGSSDWIFDGVTGGGPLDWTGPYGFKVSVMTDGVSLFSIGNGSTANNVTIRHVEMQGIGHTSTAGGSISNDGIAIYGDSNTTLSYAWMHDIGRCPVFYLGGGPSIFEYVYVQNFFAGYDPNPHGELMSASQGPMGDVTWRYSLISHTQSSGGLIWDNSQNTSSHLYVYGNIFYQPAGDTWVESNGVIGGWTGGSGEQMNNVLVYNNTFINIKVKSLSPVPNIANGNIVKNNLFYSTLAPDFTKFPTHNYNQFVSSGGISGEANGSLSSASFNNYTGLDFTLTANTPTGTNLGSPYNVDMLGHTRTTWSRGAFEFVSGVSVVLFHPADVGGDMDVNFSEYLAFANCWRNPVICVNWNGSGSGVSLSEWANAGSIWKYSGQMYHYVSGTSCPPSAPSTCWIAGN